MRIVNVCVFFFSLLIKILRKARGRKLAWMVHRICHTIVKMLKSLTMFLHAQHTAKDREKDTQKHCLYQCDLHSLHYSFICDVLQKQSHRLVTYIYTSLHDKRDSEREALIHDGSWIVRMYVLCIAYCVRCTRGRAYIDIEVYVLPFAHSTFIEHFYKAIQTDGFVKEKSRSRLSIALWQKCGEEKKTHQYQRLFSECIFCQTRFHSISCIPKMMKLDVCDIGIYQV